MQPHRGHLGVPASLLEQHVLLPVPLAPAGPTVFLGTPPMKPPLLPARFPVPPPAPSGQRGPGVVWPSSKHEAGTAGDHQTGAATAVLASSPLERTSAPCPPHAASPNASLGSGTGRPTAHAETVSNTPGSEWLLLNIQKSKVNIAAND